MRILIKVYKYLKHTSIYRFHLDSLGGMNYRYSNCNTIMWLNERINRSENLPKFITYCAMEKLSFLYLLQLIHIHVYFKKLFDYSIILFTSIGAKFNYRFAGVYGFHIHEQMYYRIGTLLPDFETQFQFAQMYICDTNHELQNRYTILTIKFF